jgi:hypothetical protein
MEQSKPKLVRLEVGLQLKSRGRSAMKNNAFSWLLMGLLVLLAPRANTQQSSSEEFSDQAEAARLRRLAEAVHLPLAREVEFRSEANLVGFRSKEALFSRRNDSRTYFIQDLRPERGKEMFRGHDEEFIERLREVFRSLEVPAAEIAQSKVLQEQMQEGHPDRETNKLVVEEAHAGKRWATASRQVEGLPVFSSRALLSLSSDGSIGFLELHWPVIPPDTLREAHQLAYKVREGWRPPALEGARVESMEAGIVHSPAVGFVMDIYPAIRVIYAPSEKGFGKKAVRYLDRNGHEIPLPRQFAAPPEQPTGKQRPLREPKDK